MARTPNTSWAGLAFPAATALESSVRRCGWYQAVPSRPFRPLPENIVAKRRMGVISPACSQPRGVPLAASRPM